MRRTAAVATRCRVVARPSGLATAIGIASLYKIDPIAAYRPRHSQIGLARTDSFKGKRDLQNRSSEKAACHRRGHRTSTEPPADLLATVTFFGSPRLSSSSPGRTAWRSARCCARVITPRPPVEENAMIGTKPGGQAITVLTPARLICDRAPSSNRWVITLPIDAFFPLDPELAEECERTTGEQN